MYVTTSLKIVYTVLSLFCSILTKTRTNKIKYIDLRLFRKHVKRLYTKLIIQVKKYLNLS